MHDRWQPSAKNNRIVQCIVHDTNNDEIVRWFDCVGALSPAQSWHNCYLVCATRRAANSSPQDPCGVCLDMAARHTRIRLLERYDCITSSASRFLVWKIWFCYYQSGAILAFYQWNNNTLFISLLCVFMMYGSQFPVTPCDQCTRTH